MAKLNGTKTHENLKSAFAGESQANRRYLYFAKVDDIAEWFETLAKAEKSHAGRFAKAAQTLG